MRGLQLRGGGRKRIGLIGRVMNYLCIGKNLELNAQLEENNYCKNTSDVGKIFEVR